MGQKIHPKGLRLGYVADWDSKWFSRRNMADLLEEDFRIRKFVKTRLKFAAVSKIMIERAGKYLKVNIFSARPGLVIGKRGADVESLKKEIEEISDKKTMVNIMEIKSPETNAQLVAEGIALQLEKKGSYRRAMKKAIEKAIERGALGIKVMVAGRLGGNEIARTEWLKEGRIPLQTFRADIDYGFAESLTTMGIIGVKVWVFKKEFYKKTEKEMIKEARLVEKPEDIERKEEEIPAPEEDIEEESEEEDNVVSEKGKI
ncbi:MAG: 30S ribosomal protein S3 [Elusimicrobia bacterium]|nr:30S ribosomal protein S3 [Elusimicrobiota bacterium]